MVKVIITFYQYSSLQLTGKLSTSKQFFLSCMHYRTNLHACL